MHSVQRFSVSRFRRRTGPDDRRLAGLHPSPLDRGARTRRRRRTCRDRVLPQRDATASRPCRNSSHGSGTNTNEVIGANPFAWCNRVERPRGGNIRTSIVLARASSRRCGTSRARSSGSRCMACSAGPTSGCRHTRAASSSTSTTRRWSPSTTGAKAAGSRRSRSRSDIPTSPGTFVGCSSCSDAVGPDCTLMADANEAWSPKEAIRRLHAFQDAGIDLLWIEDPCLRDDIDGLRSISHAAPTRARQRRRVPRPVGQAASSSTSTPSTSSTCTARSPKRCRSAGSRPNTASRRGREHQLRDRRPRRRRTPRGRLARVLVSCRTTICWRRRSSSARDTPSRPIGRATACGSPRRLQRASVAVVTTT